MKFHVYSRQDAEKADFKLYHIWISITDPKAPLAALKEHDATLGILRLQFHDVDPKFYDLDDLASRGIYGMSEEQAKEILDFVDEHKDDVAIIAIHCEAGISRSQGVRSALSLLLDGYEERGGVPNIHCKSLLLREARKR